MLFNSSCLYGMEAKVKAINNVITSTLKGSGKLMLISGEEGSEKSAIINFAQNILKLKSEVFSCFIHGEEFYSYNCILKHILNECYIKYPNIYKKISHMQSTNIERITSGKQTITNAVILDILELIAEEYPLIILIDRIDEFGAKPLELLKDISYFIPYNKFTIICTLKDADHITFIDQLELESFTLRVPLTPSKAYEITDSYHITSLFNKSGLPPNDINIIIKLFLQCSIQLMNYDISQTSGLIKYLNDNDSLNYYEAIACYIVLLLKNDQRYKALMLTKKIIRKLSQRLKKFENEDANKVKALKCFILGSYYCYINKENTAISILKKGLSFIDKDLFCEYHNALGCAYMSIGDWMNSEECLLKAYESSKEEGSFLPHLHINLIQLYNFKCEFNRANYYYTMLKGVKFQIKNEFIETLLDLLFLSISPAIGNNNNLNASYEILMNKLLSKVFFDNNPLYHFSFLRLYIIAGDYLFRCKNFKSSMQLYEKAIINYEDYINEPYIKDFINIRIMACRSMLGFKADKFISDLNLDYKIQSSFQKYMLCSAFFFAYFVYLSSGDSTKAKKHLLRSIRYARSSGNLVYKAMGYYELYKLYVPVDLKKSKLYQRKYIEAASAMGISPNNVPYTYADAKQQNNDERIIQIINFIKQEYKADISLSMLSQEIHLSDTHICHLIKENTGYTFKELLLQTRIQEARKMLTGTILNISDIAASVGFSSSKYFCKVFKERCGFTPSSYRKKHHNHNIKEYV